MSAVKTQGDLWAFIARQKGVVLGGKNDAYDNFGNKPEPGTFQIQVCAT
jgi:hypothetical protein